MTKRKLIAITAAIIVILGSVMGVAWFCSWWYAKPGAAINYTVVFNEMRRPDGYMPEDDGWNIFVKACNKLVDGPSLKPMTSLSDMNDAQLHEVRIWIAANEPAFRCLDDAMSKPFFWPTSVPSSGPLHGLHEDMSGGLHSVWDLGWAMIWRGKMKAYDGDVAGGVRDMVTAAEIVKCFGDKPTWSEWKAGAELAITAYRMLAEVVRQQTLSSSSLVDLMHGVEKSERRFEPVYPQLAASRLVFLDMVQKMFTDEGNGDGRIIPSRTWDLVSSDTTRMSGRQSRLGRFFSAIKIGREHPGRRATVESYDTQMASFKEIWESREHGNDPESWWGGQRLYYRMPLVDNRFIMSYFQPGSPTTLGQLWTLRNDALRVQATIAVMRYKVEMGRLPDGWDDVVNKAYLKEPPIDWFGGKPFVYERTGDSFIIYWSEYEKKMQAEAAEETDDPE